jgi:hypothetical protein
LKLRITPTLSLVWQGQLTVLTFGFRDLYFHRQFRGQDHQALGIRVPTTHFLRRSTFNVQHPRVLILSSHASQLTGAILFGPKVCICNIPRDIFASIRPAQEAHSIVCIHHDTCTSPALTSSCRTVHIKHHTLMTHST